MDPESHTRHAPASLSGRAASLLQNGPLDALVLMREVCKISDMTADAAHRIAEVLLAPKEEFVQLDDNRWALLDNGVIVMSKLQGGDKDTGSSGNLDSLGGLKSVKFAVVDVETTGSMSNGDDRITEIAVVPVENGEVGEPWQRLVNPCRPIPPFIARLTGISDDMVANAPLFLDIALELRQKLSGRVFVAHNAPFDRRFVDSELRRADGDGMQHQVLCTVRMARKFLPSLRRRSLDVVCEHFGLSIEGRHRAGGDAYATAQVLVRLLRIASDNGIGSMSALESFMSSQSKSGTKTRSRKTSFPFPATGDNSA